MGWAPSSLQAGAGDQRVFHGRGRLPVRVHVCLHPLPRPGATLGFSTPREATADSPWGLLGGHSCCRKASSPKACRRGLFPVGGPGVLPREPDSGATGRGEERCLFLGMGSSITSPRNILTAVASPTAPALRAHDPRPSPRAVCNTCVSLHHRYTSVFRPMCLRACCVCMASTCVCQSACLCTGERP